MKFVVQRVKNAQVDVDNKTVGKIDNGFLVLIGITHTDTKEIADYLVKKLINLRVFEDENGKMNNSKYNLFISKCKNCTLEEQAIINILKVNSTITQEEIAKQINSKLSRWLQVVMYDKMNKLCIVDKSKNLC